MCCTNKRHPANADGVRDFGRRKLPLPAVPIQIPSIAIHIPVLAAQFSTFMPRRTVVPIIQIAVKLAPVMDDLGFIVPDIPAVAPSIVGKHGSRTHSDQQQNSCNCPFHIFVLPRIPRILLNTNTPPRAELRVTKGV
jgi:hypothetical protein